MRVLIGCEYSGHVRDAFIAAGHDALSCDLVASEVPGPHYTGSVLDILEDGWDLGIFHPPCTYLTLSGMHWTARGIRDEKLTEDALEFVYRLMNAPIPKVAIENPVGCISSRIRKPDQIVHPYQFGDDASKRTCLWLKNLPLLVPTDPVPPRLVQYGGKQAKRWANQTDAGQNRLPPASGRWKARSTTYLGIARAMAAQWGA